MPEVVLGVMLVAGCALGAVLWQQRNDDTRTVVVAARPITRGAVIVADDLRGAAVGGDLGGLIDGSQARILLGQVAAVDIAIDTPLSPTLVVGDRPLEAGEALTSVALEPGQVPPDLAVNDRVRIVVTTPGDVAGLSMTTLLDAEAVVWSVDLAQDGISLVVTVRGPLSLATDVSAATDVRIARVGG